MANSSDIAYPEWTEYRKKNGLDPLGMQTSSVGLYQTLLPGISNVTLRIRYYGYYAWLSRVYARRVGSTDPKEWQRFVRRAEALYALIAQLTGGETGIAGVTWAAEALESQKTDSIDFASAAEPGSANYYLKQAWGAYGAAYASQLFEIGIYAQSDKHELPIPSPQMGEPLAIAFGESIGSSLERGLFESISSGIVTRENLALFSPMLPSAIPADGSERELYEKILFAQLDIDGRGHTERRHTLKLILDVAARNKQRPKPDDVRWALYNNQDSNGLILQYTSLALRDHRLRWWVYHANDLIHVAYETLLKFVLDMLEPYASGVALEALISEAVNTIISTIGESPANWESFLSSDISADLNAEEELSKLAIQGAGPKKICTPESAWSAVKLLGTVHKRSRLLGEEIRTDLQLLNPSVFRSLLTETEYLDRESDQDFSRTLIKLIEERVIRRHLWVALRKLRYQGDYTFLIESDEGKVRLRVKDGPVFTNPRLGPAISFLKDIYLIGDDGITKQGRLILDSV